MLRALIARFKRLTLQASSQSLPPAPAENIGDPRLFSPAEQGSGIFGQWVEFMAQCCTGYLEQRGVRISVSDVASPWQNGYVESFFGRFKQELGRSRPLRNSW